MYDFTKIIDRHNLDALAVDSIGTDEVFSVGGPKEGFDAIPMWVADMNFETVPTIIEQIQKRAAHPLFGYFVTKDEYYDAIINWHKTRNNVEELKKEQIGYENGVLGCVCSAIRTFTDVNEKVLLHSPTYIGFTHSIEDTNRVAEHTPLVKDENGVWRMDYEDMEKRIKDHHIRLAILCNPHNPCGRVWERWELEKAYEIYKKYDVTVISDEIWSDIIMPGHQHIPAQTINEDAKNRTIAIYAPSKTFNLAGLIGSYHIIYNQAIKDQIMKVENATHYNSLNVLSQYALMGAYTKEGAAWTDQLCEVIDTNLQKMHTYLSSVEGVDVYKPQGTYMLYVHFEEYCKKHNLTQHELLELGWDYGIAWQDGAPFFDEWAIRINVALPTSLVEEAIDRLQKYVLK